MTGLDWRGSFAAGFVLATFCMKRLRAETGRDGQLLPTSRLFSLISHPVLPNGGGLT
jgi:hypothetical protein